MTRRSFRQALWRYIVATHRWLGVALGLLVLLWCLSGVVMMYQQYPAVERAEQLAGLDILNFGQCCRQPAADVAVRPASPYKLEMLLGRPVLRFLGPHTNDILDLETGRTISTWTNEQLDIAGRAHARRQAWPAPTSIRDVVRDQWTVQGQFNAHRPLRNFRNSDGRSWYVSRATAEIVQVTSRAERFWNWLGAVPHWLYPTELRRHPAVWAQIVIWLSVVSLFLAVTGIVIGITRYRWSTPGKRSPYSSWWLWHHYAGLFFGLFTLTWLFSGLFSMNPWGTLESRSFAPERRIVNGVGASIGEVVDSVRRVARNVPRDAVRLESAYWLGRPHWLAYDRLGRAERLTSDGKAAPLAVRDAADAASALNLTDARIDRLNAGDAYYYRHHEDVELPAIRITDGTGERYYIGSATGRLHRVADRNDRRQRWVFRALHRGDFHPVLRQRPIWDVFMLLLLIGTTAGAATGTWIGLRRVSGRQGHARSRAPGS